MSSFDQDLSDALGCWIIPVTFTLTLVISAIWFSISAAFC